MATRDAVAAPPALERDAGGGEPEPPVDDHQTPRHRGTRSAAALVPLWRPVAIFAASRAGVLAVAGAVAYLQRKSLLAVLGRWDAGLYLQIARHGYQRGLPPASGTAQQWKDLIALFPLYPLLIRAAHDATGIGLVKAGYLVAAAGGLAAAVLVWLLVRDRYGPGAADRATALVFCFPGAFVLSMTYSENVLLPLVAGCLLALARRRYVVAGVLAALATAADPAGIAVVVPCAWAALTALRKERRWVSLAAPLLAPAGALAYFGYLWAHAGTPLAWFKVERRGWAEQTTPLAVWDQLHKFFHYGVTYPNYTAMAAGFLVAVVVAAYAIWKRCDASWLAYGLAVCVIGLLTPRHGFMPRPLLHAFPLVAFAGVGLRRAAFTAVLVLSALLMAACAIVSLGTLGLTP